MGIARSLAAAPLAFAAGWQLLSQPHSGPAAMLAVATVVLAGLALAVLAHGTRLGTAVTAGPLTSRASALRAKSAGAVFQRQRDPDAAGHARPRAPGAIPAAA
jgi:Family of unknown function (DUF6412)